MLELNEEYRAQQRRQKQQQHQQQAKQPKIAPRERSPPRRSAATNNAHRDTSIAQEVARQTSSPHHPRSAPATPGDVAKSQHDETGERYQQTASSTEPEEGQHRHQRLPESHERDKEDQSGDGARTQRQEGREGAGGTRKGGNRARESNDVVFVLRKLYTGGGLDAQQQSWDCMPTNLFNTLTLQLGTLSKVSFWGACFFRKPSSARSRSHKQQLCSALPMLLGREPTVCAWKGNPNNCPRTRDTRKVRICGEFKNRSKLPCSSAHHIVPSTTSVGHRFAGEIDLHLQLIYLY